MKHTLILMTLLLSACAMAGCAVEPEAETMPDGASETSSTSAEALTATVKRVRGMHAHRLFTAMDRAGLFVDGGAGSLYVAAKKLACTTSDGDSSCRITPPPDPWTGAVPAMYTIEGKRADALADALAAIGGVARASGGGRKSTVVNVTCQERNDGFGSGSADHDASCTMKVSK